MFDLDGLGRFTYVAMEAAIIGGALLFVVAFHIPILWRHWRALALTTALAVIYGSALDAWAIRSGWGWFSPALTSGIWFGSLLLEELTFWIGAALVTASAALVMAEATDRGTPWWALPVALVFPSWMWLNMSKPMMVGPRH